MLNGVDPIIIFQFFKTVETFENLVAAIPVATGEEQKLILPPIPIYLSEKLTGLYIDNEDKSIEIETKNEATQDGKDPKTNQKPIGSTVKINMIAHRDSIGLTLLSALADQIVPKVTSQEYSITYLHGVTTVFGGLLHSFNIQQNTDNELCNVTLEITKTTTKTEKPTDAPVVERIEKPVDLSNASPTAAIGAGPSAGTSPSKIPVTKGASGSWGTGASGGW